MEGEQVNHSCCMGFISHSYGGLVGGRDGGGGWDAYGTRLGGGSCMSYGAEALPECEMKTMTPDHTAFQERSFGYGGAGIGGSS